MQNDIEKYMPQGEMVIYRTDDGKASLDVILAVINPSENGSRTVISRRSTDGEPTVKAKMRIRMGKERDKKLFKNIKFTKI